MSNFHSVKITDIKKETKDCVSISFDIPDSLKSAFKFTAGQYLTLKTKINGESLRRSYSLCSSPNDNEWRVAIKQIPEGRFSTFANNSLKVGDQIETMLPMGNFVVKTDQKNSKKYAAYTAGSGITPIMSIMKAILEEEENSNFVLFYGNQTKDSIIFYHEIESLKAKYAERLTVHYVLSREETENPLFSGRITPQRCDDFSNNLKGLDNIDEYYFCGPGGMVQVLKDHFLSQGIDAKKIHAELFSAPESEVEITPSSISQDEILTGSSTVEITIDDEKYEFELKFGTRNILDAAVEEGIDVPFACKGGVCCTCRAQVTEGEVEMKMNYALEPEEVEDGFVLSCQSYPKSNKVKLDFDA